MVSNTKLFSVALLALMACSLQSCGSASGSSRAADVVSTTNDDTNNIIDGLKRTCRIPVRYTDSAAHTKALESLVQARVIKKERPTTMCVGALDSPLTNFDASMRIEYEDNIGLRWATFRKRDLVYSTQANGKFRLIYLDNYGYVDLSATQNTAGTYNGSVRLANIDATQSYLEEIDAFLKLIQATCAASPAKCLNPVFIQDPYADVPPTQAQIIQRANEALGGQHGATAFTLGTVSFTDDYIERKLF